LRAISAETKLSLMAGIPSDSIGWLKFRKEKAKEALRDILDAMDAENK